MYYHERKQKDNFPGRQTPKEEVVMGIRLRMWMGIVRHYYNTETRDGVQILDQLYKEQMHGRKSVIIKVRKGNLHISPSEKGISGYVQRYVL